jgi:hypothetical protein
MIWRFCSGLKTFSTRWTSMSGIVILLCWPRQARTSDNMHAAAGKSFQNALILSSDAP